ncbi:nucleotidyltransferase family protein [Gloeocapsopsis dulcis]|uniref:MobA-like protein n=1 Tax=Gloeocapsopsis dulcis AAB1 = 1H9 TaxID=1433147 RepID=A0A6N8FSA4_9CHRO|nr:nucleotidyltransferase family protein [Gloeocapsopsis dulcis]MUL35729.1 MobA-like protein [Gloeocapsopsis dulcis AAB1 = 1H9]WNN90988.1 nucleotidyltransferase family protein [Gloeocapsopsis dulcis]
MPLQTFNCFALILAAGASSRMGTCKASLPWRNGKSLLSYQVEQLSLAKIIPIVVLGLHNFKQSQVPAGTIVAINHDPSAGKVSSILTGLKHVPKFDCLLISAVDQPRSNWIYQKLLQTHQFSAKVPIIAPHYRGKLGHPLLFSSSVRSHLENLSEADFGLRHIIQTFYPQIQRVEFDTSEVLWDLNTPEAYQAALQTQA